MAKKAVEIELTPEQQEQVRKLTGQAVAEVEVKLEQLEGRVIPRIVIN
jgi:hypothetical protein